MTQTWVKRGNLGRPSSKGSAAVGALGLGATKDVVVTLSPAMPSATYAPVATIQATTALLASVQVQGIVAQTASTVTVRVQAVGVLATGATVNVVAVG